MKKNYKPEGTMLYPGVILRGNSVILKSPEDNVRVKEKAAKKPDQNLKANQKSASSRRTNTAKQSN